MYWDTIDLAWWMKVVYYRIILHSYLSFRACLMLYLFYCWFVWCLNMFPIAFYWMCGGHSSFVMMIHVTRQSANSEIILLQFYFTRVLSHEINKRTKTIFRLDKQLWIPNDVTCHCVSYQKVEIQQKTAWKFVQCRCDIILHHIYLLLDVVNMSLCLHQGLFRPGFSCAFQICMLTFSHTYTQNSKLWAKTCSMV